ncbi:hypothetical protein T492DRAFT_944658 [Pavlovales sp. CCMP2436]|nr:hypothetical protein T492DRAFT_944658 [Pavlovales sp. CCMP2436]
MSVIVATTVEAPITPVEDACYICLETGDAGDRALAANVCACLTSRVHVRCVEIMVNSTARRAKTLAERTACPVCTRPYTIDFAPYLIDVTGRHPCRRWALSSSGRLVLQCAAVLVALGVIATLGIWLPRGIAIIAALAIGVVFGSFVLVFKARRFALKTNDNVFHERAVAQARRTVGRGHRCPIEEATAANPKRVILVAQGRLTACVTAQNPSAPADATAFFGGSTDDAGAATATITMATVRTRT